jgi:hypothetical protein
MTRAGVAKEKGRGRDQKKKKKKKKEELRTAPGIVNWLLQILQSHLLAFPPSPENVDVMDVGCFRVGPTTARTR